MEIIDLLLLTNHLWELVSISYYISFYATSITIRFDSSEVFPFGVVVSF